MTSFEQTFNALAHGGHVRWFARRDLGSLGGVAFSSDSLAERLSANKRGYNTYVQLNPSAGFRGLRSSASNITHFRGFLLDLDPNPGYSPNGDSVGVITDVITQLESLLGIGLSPWIIDSGRGIQAWVMGCPEVLDRPDWRTVARRNVSSLIAQLKVDANWHADPMTCDVSRVARLPGTINHKTGRVASMVQEGTPVEGLWPALEALDVTIAAAPDLPQIAQTKDSYKQVWEKLTSMAQNFTQTGWSYPGRHTALWHTIDLLAKLGLTRDAAARAAWLGARQCTPPLAWSDVQTALARVYKKGIDVEVVEV